MPLHVFFPCFGTKTVLFLERELCIKHGVTLVYTSSVRQALDDNKINAKSTEITDLTYQYDDKKYLQKKTFFVFFVCFFFPGHLRKIYWSECIFQPRQHFWQRTKWWEYFPKIYICLESQILVCKTCTRKLERQIVGVWKSGKPESGIGTGIGTGTGTGTGIGTGMGRETYIKTGTTFTLI